VFVKTCGLLSPAVLFAAGSGDDSHRVLTGLIQCNVSIVGPFQTACNRLAAFGLALVSSLVLRSS